MKVKLILLALSIAFGQIDNVKFFSYPDNDFSNCVFVIQLEDADYGANYVGGPSITS